jgi:signal transduction histidine kinase
VGFLSRSVAALDPRRRLAAAVGWSLLAASLLAAGLASEGAGRAAANAARADTERLLRQFADQIANEIAVRLAARRDAVALAASFLASDAARRRPEDARRLFASLQGSQPDLAWLAFADPGGRVLAATAGVGEGQILASRTWFVQGATAPWIGEVHEEASPAEPPVPITRSEQRLLVEIGAPVRDPAGKLLGVVGAQLSWSWVEAFERNLAADLHTRRTVDLLLGAGDRTLLVAPSGLRGQRLGGAGVDPSAGGHYLVATSRTDGVRDLAGLEWTVLVREPIAEAVAGSEQLRLRIFAIVGALGVASALASLWLTQLLMRRLEALASDADRVRRHEIENLAEVGGRDEVHRLGGALRSLLTALGQERRALVELNQQLDAKVAERTAQVERLAEEQKYAAVVRERLRLARDLHDTLAHSMMALLTQIRLLRKLEQTAPQTLPAELARTEEAAQTGLQEARNAITQMRYNAVRDAGLGAALDGLLARFTERSSVRHRFVAAPDAAQFADERAETLFRIVEEALNNVERHARATEVVVTLKYADDAPGTLLLEVADDGVGFDPGRAAPGHYGLRGMREQAALIGADLSISSTPQAGARVRIALESARPTR